MYSIFKWQIHSSASCFHCFVAFIILYGQKKNKILYVRMLSRLESVLKT